MTNSRKWLFALVAILLPFEGRSETPSQKQGVPYTKQGDFDLPGADPKQAVFDVLQDGRLIVIDGKVAYIETAINSWKFKEVGKLDTQGTPGFLRVSPDGKTAVTGVYDPKTPKVLLFETANLKMVKSFDADNYDAAWVGDTMIAICAGKAPGAINLDPVVTILDVKTGANKTIIEKIGKGSGGVAIGSNGYLYVGDGFDDQGKIGAIKAFSQKEWNGALGTGTPLHFKTKASVAKLLSATPLGFDKEGSFYVGGGDNLAGSGDTGYIAVVTSAALQNALQTGKEITSGSPPDQLQKIVPAASKQPSWFVVANGVTGALYLRDYGSAKVYVYERK